MEVSGTPGWLENRIDAAWEFEQAAQRAAKGLETSAEQAQIRDARSNFSGLFNAALSAELVEALGAKIVHAPINGEPYLHVARIKYKDIRCEVWCHTHEDCVTDEPSWQGARRLSGWNTIPNADRYPHLCGFECATDKLEQTLLAALGRWSDRVSPSPD
jgi:hypothetical protein